MLPDKETITVIEELNLPTSNIILIDNSAFEELDFESLMKNIANCNSAVKRAIFDQRRSYQYNKENIKLLIDACQQFEPFDTKLIEPIWFANSKLLSTIGTFIDMKNKNLSTMLSIFFFCSLLILFVCLLVVELFVLRASQTIIKI